jgi:hypothetical protein
MRGRGTGAATRIEIYDRHVGEAMNMRNWHSLHCLIAASVLVSAWSPARATVVIESYRIERPLDADLILAPVYAGLSERGVLARPDQVLAEIRGSLPMPVNDNFDISVSDVMQRIDLGTSKARYGKNDEAIHLFEKALEDLRNNPAMTTSLDDGRKWITKALAGLARAHHEKGNLKEAAEAIAEHVRSFPEFPIDRETYGPKLASFYVKTRNILDAQPRGKLLLMVDLADARIFINEYERGAGGQIDLEPAPGEYRILIRVGGAARRYRVRIDPQDGIMMRINWYTDAAFVVSREWLGFVWPVRIRDEEELPEFVFRILKQNMAHGVIVLGVVRRGGHRYITARSFGSRTGEYIGGVSIELGARDNARIEALVRFLAMGERSSELLPLVRDPDGLEPRPAGPARWPIWVATATAAGAFAAGGYLLHADGSCRDDACMETRHTARWAWAAASVGVAAIAFGAYRYSRARSKSGAEIGFQPRSSGGLLTVSGGF